MLRWKLFSLLAIILTLVGLLGNKYIASSAHHRQISLLEESGQCIAVNSDCLLITIGPQDDLFASLSSLDPEKVESALAGRSLFIEREEYTQVDLQMKTRTDLILAEAIATGEYYKASKQLETIAEEQGYSSILFFWGKRLVTELNDGHHSYITQQFGGVNP